MSGYNERRVRVVRIYLQLWMVEHLVCGSYEDRSKV